MIMPIIRGSAYKRHFDAKVSSRYGSQMSKSKCNHVLCKMCLLYKGWWPYLVGFWFSWLNYLLITIRYFTLGLPHLGLLYWLGESANPHTCRPIRSICTRLGRVQGELFWLGNPISLQAV